jgi:hypothetical protein
VEIGPHYIGMAQSHQSRAGDEVGFSRHAWSGVDLKRVRRAGAGDHEVDADRSPTVQWLPQDAGVARDQVLYVGRELCWLHGHSALAANVQLGVRVVELRLVHVCGQRREGDYASRELKQAHRHGCPGDELLDQDRRGVHYY